MVQPIIVVLQRCAHHMYSRSPQNPALQLWQESSKSASTTPQRPIWNSFATVGVRDFWENGCNSECCAGIFASIVHLPSNCIISIRPLACFYTMQEALMVCHRTLQARAVRPPQRRWSRLPPDAGSELAAGGARAAKRMRLRRCSAVAVRPPLTVASWSTRGAVSVKASNSGGDYPKSRPGPTTFLTVGFMADDGYESSPHVDEAGQWHFVGLRRCRRRPSARTRSLRGHDELKSTIFNHAAAMTCSVDL